MATRSIYYSYKECRACGEHLGYKYHETIKQKGGRTLYFCTDCIAKMCGGAKHERK